MLNKNIVRHHLSHFSSKALVLVAQSVSLADLKNNIVSTINECADILEGMITRNAVSIEALKNSIDFALAEVESLETDVREDQNCQ